MPLCRRKSAAWEYLVFREGVASPVGLPARTILAATTGKDTLVSDGWQLMRLQAGQAIPLWGTSRDEHPEVEALDIRSLLSSRWISLPVRDMVAFGDKIYVICGDNLYIWSRQAGLRPYEGGQDMTGLSMLESRDNMLLGIDASGITVLDGGGDPGWTGQPYDRAAVNTLTVHDGSLFIGTRHDGLCVVTPERLRFTAQDGERGALGIALWQDTIRTARGPQGDCDDVFRAPDPDDDGYCFYDGGGTYAQACGRGTVFWDDRGAYAWYDAPSMQYIVADSRNNVYLGASRFVLRIPADALRDRRQAVPDTLRKTKGLTLLKVVGDSVFIGDEGEITIIAGDRQAVLPFPAIRDVVPVGEGMLYLGYGTQCRYVPHGGAAGDVAWAHAVLAPAFFNAGFQEGGFTYFTSDEGLYYVRTALLTACLAHGAVVPLARITLAGRSMIEFNGGFSGSAVKYKGDWYLPAINGVVRMRPPPLENIRTTWRLTLSDGRDTAVTAIPGDEHVWHSPVVDLGIDWDYLPQIGELLMQMSINGVMQYRGGLVRSNRFFLRRGLNRVEVSVFHPLLPDGRQTFTVLVDRRLPLLARVDFWILVAAVMLLAGLVAFAYSTQRYRRILRAHQGLLRDKAVLLEAWYANPGNQAASPHEDILRSYMHDIEGGLKVSADTLKLLARPGNQSPEMLVEVARGLEALLEICRRTSMEIIPPAHASDTPSQTVQKIIESAVTHNQGYARAKAVDVVINGDVRLPWKAAPELGRVLYVLVNNAIKFSMPGQKVEVSVAVSNQVLNITITDEGRGFRLEGDPARQPSHIPSSPGTSGEVGSGQGVYLAGRLVDEMGGVLSLAPRRNQPGTIATVSLPVA
jgi:signal transduction histidine kinase